MSIAHPIAFNGGKRAVETAPPPHGEHTRAIPAAAGYPPAEIDRLVASSVIIG